MAKASIAGRTKTRLVPPLSFDEAAAFNTAFLQDIASLLVDARAAKAGISGYMAFGPPESEPFFRRTMPAEIGLMEIWYPDFGDCLFATICGLFECDHTSAVVLNSDSPTLPISLLIETAGILAQPGDRAVLGPARDGGYYLLGLKHPHRRMFEEIDWSTDRVARQTMQRAQEIGLAVHVLPTWYDVDDAEALRVLHAELCGRSFDSALRPSYPSHTAALAESLLAAGDFGQRIGVADARARDLATEERGDGNPVSA
jgi:uncharacterized protein